MEASCRKALDLGLPSIAFTEHADFVKVFDDQRPLDRAAYLECVERCRSAFPELRILSGVELGEPHRFPAETAALLGTGSFDRVLGSVHCVTSEAGLHDMSQKEAWAGDPAELVRRYLGEVLALAASAAPFAVLAHLDYFKRYWPHGERPFDEREFEAEYRDILRAAAKREAVLEINTTRGAEPHRGLCPGPVVLRWWREEGGRAVSFGSDAHEPARIAAGFAFAAGVAEAAGFRPADDPNGFWRG
jgi:histidinol-phosphatase (PHP family)